MNQAPSTWAGRTIYICQLFFGQLLVALYVGNLVTFLGNVTPKTPLNSVNDLFDSTSPNYSPSNSICIPSQFPEINSYVQQQSLLYPNARFVTVHAATLEECIMQVYLGKATATFYQRSVVLTILQQYALSGMCSSDGGYCTNSEGPQTDLIDQTDCLCPPTLKLANGACQNPLKNVWNPVQGSLHFSALFHIWLPVLIDIFAGTC